MRVEIQAKKIEINSHEEIPDVVKGRRNILLEVNHSASSPDFYDYTTLKSRHRISIIYYEEDAKRKREIGSADCHLVVLLIDDNKEKLQSIFDVWNTRGYNEVPLDVRVAIENTISFMILPALGVVAEKVRLPPPMPPVSFSPRPTQKELRK